MRQIIRITESDLHNIVRNTVKRMLREDLDFPNDAQSIARQKLIDEIQKGVEMNIHAYRGNGYGELYMETEDGWIFSAEDIPVNIEVESWSYYRPATHWEPEESEGPQGYVESVDYSNVEFECYPPNRKPLEKPAFTIKVDSEIEQLLDEYCDVDNIDDALNELEEEYLDDEEYRRCEAAEAY